MINNRFVLYQIKREIKRNPTKLKFYRVELNKFGEPTGKSVLFREYTGLYHEHAPHMLDTYRILTGQTAGDTRTEKTPQLMVPYEDFYFLNDSGEKEWHEVNVGDEVDLNGRKCRVTGVLNVQEWNLLMDISFEEVDDGGNTGKPNQ